MPKLGFVDPQRDQNMNGTFCPLHNKTNTTII